mgnify:CR=1 FL=1
MLLNSKSILNCNEEEEKEHNNEIEEISKMIYSLPNYDCAIIIKYVDKANEKRKEEKHGTIYRAFVNGGRACDGCIRSVRL